MNNKQNSKGNRTIYVAALNNIFIAMKGLRIFDRFGFNLPKQTKKNNNAFVTVDYDKWIYEPQVRDWLNESSDIRLSNYQPPTQLIDLLTNNINFILE